MKKIDQHAIAARIQSLIVQRHTRGEEEKQSTEILLLTNSLHSQYNNESTFVMTPREARIRKLEEQNRYLEQCLNKLKSEQKPAKRSRINKFRAVGKAIIGAKRVAGSRWKKRVIQRVWKTDLKINDLNFASILLAAKKEKHEALFRAAVTYVARGLKRLKMTEQFKKLQNDPDILISILEQAKSPRGKHSKYVYLS